MMTKNELLKTLILLARFVETTGKIDNALAEVYDIVEKELRQVAPEMTATQLYEIIDARCRVDESLRSDDGRPQPTFEQM